MLITLYKRLYLIIYVIDIGLYIYCFVTHKSQYLIVFSNQQLFVTESLKTVRFINDFYK